MDSKHGQSFTSDIEILRGELSNIFFEVSKDKVKYMLDDSITSTHDDGNKVKVSFAKGSVQEFEPVIGADSTGSTTRRLVFPDESPKKSLGQYMS